MTSGLTAKHFNKIAEILNKTIEDEDLITVYPDLEPVEVKFIVTETVKSINNKFLNYFKTQNKDFDEERFKQAVFGVEE